MTMAATHAHQQPRLRVTPTRRPGPKIRTAADKILGALVHDGLLPFTFRANSTEAIALASLMRDIHRHWGHSGTLAAVDLTRDYVNGTRRFDHPAAATDAMQRCDTTLSQLQRHERGLIQWLETSRGRANVTLAMLGREWCHGTDDRDAAQRATGALQSLARSIAEHYPARNLTTGYNRPRKRPPRAA